ncbi:MAG: ribosome recycling factor [Verrucomicrobia bacterium 21-51-4]|nr:MAG: ribosome recycling factor [Verrucomicrobia bacterium 21-51-4]HQU08935.1 ribosome recycling factor [Opitutales bacterium]
MFDPKKILEEAKSKMNKAVERTLHSYSTLHTGKASPSMVESVVVDAYGTNMRLREVAAITTPDHRMIMVQPWDKGMLQPIEKAIRAANLGFNPSVDGHYVRCPIPELSKDRRLELAKVAHGMAEEGRVGVRGARRDSIEVVKKGLKEKVLTEDDQKRLEKEIQHLTDQAIKEIDAHLESKEKDLMKV